MAQRFEVIEEPDVPEPKPRIDPDVILLQLRMLAQRTAIAVADLYSLLTVASVFCLALLIIPHDPSSYQLAGLAGYALFVVAINVIVRRK